MSEIKAAFQRINSSLREDASLTKGMTATYEFRFHDHEAVYQLVLNGDNSYAAEGNKEKADCTLIMTVEDFNALMDGNLNGTQAFMSGRLKIKGNMGLALKLQEVLASYNKSA